MTKIRRRRREEEQIISKDYRNTVVLMTLSFQN